VPERVTRVRVPRQVVAQCDQAATVDEVRASQPAPAQPAPDEPQGIVAGGRVSLARRPHRHCVVSRTPPRRSMPRARACRAAGSSSEAAARRGPR
jgi:hypothetical protein